MSDAQLPSDERVSADWHVDLMCDCPNCKKHVNLTEHPDFWVDRCSLHPCTEVEGLDVVCPECHHEFEVNCAY